MEFRGIFGLLGLIELIYIVNGSWRIASWSDSLVSLSTAEFASCSAYDAITNSIWIIGGDGCGTCVYTFNLTSNTIINQNSISSDADEGYATPNTVIIDQVLYFLVASALTTYDIKTKTVNYNIATLPTDMPYPCITTDNDQSLIYIVGATDKTDFHVYNTIENEWFTGPSITYVRSDTPTCQVSNNNELYIFGGKTSYIEKMNLNLLNEWNTITITVTPANIDGYGQISAKINNIIYVMSGLDSTGSLSNMYGDMYYLNTNDDSIELGSALLYRSVTNGVVVNDTIYVIGGKTTSSSGTNSIKYAVFDPPTNAPTTQSNRPSWSPTNIPSMRPSNIPSTAVPTNLPSKSPSTQSPTDATSEPSIEPTNLPTGATNGPSNVPTNSPSMEPSNAPTNFPSMQPSMVPSISPSISGCINMFNYTKCCINMFGIMLLYLLLSDKS